MNLTLRGWRQPGPGAPVAFRTYVANDASEPMSFGGRTLFGECEAACPKEISLENIARLNRELLRATLADRGAAAPEPGSV